MKIQINSTASDIIITIYVLLTLFYRISFEAQAGVSGFTSLITGVVLLSFLWLLIKLKILNPNWFGLFNKKTTKS
ncbi:hypothetical protein SAMN05661096_03537 [Marivirga sericea]|uniref:Uncharacterized protein n=1 Tax=Marivirga sericea TaxID=1028 RepID=A0A1X7L6V6_9BACT|nr:hypothetical protein [Marivirga sericea]SMG48859.1 hypothetical protein SAMN05661096_03537 [Marivirga sericea]